MLQTDIIIIVVLVVVVVVVDMIGQTVLINV